MNAHTGSENSTHAGFHHSARTTQVLTTATTTATKVVSQATRTGTSGAIPVIPAAKLRRPAARRLTPEPPLIPAAKRLTAAARQGIRGSGGASGGAETAPEPLAMAATVEAEAGSEFLAEVGEAPG